MVTTNKKYWSKFDFMFTNIIESSKNAEKPIEHHLRFKLKQGKQVKILSGQTFMVLMNKEPGGLNLLWNVLRLFLYNQSLTNLFNLSNEVFISSAKHHIIWCKLSFNFSYDRKEKLHHLVQGRLNWNNFFSWLSLTLQSKTVH